VRLRVKLFGLPYGDQALFVRRPLFEAMGGYRDVPLMEDVDFVQRLKQAGRLLHHHLPVVTSARRWERDGWWRRSAQNVSLISRYFRGESIAALARRYQSRQSTAVAMMARAPWMKGKTRLAPHLDDRQHRALRDALFGDTLDVVRRVALADRYVICEPPSECERLRAVVGDGIDVIAQQPGDLGRRLQEAFRDLFRLAAERAIVIGSDLPDLPPAFIEAAAQALEHAGDRVVLGPAADGGYFLVGLKSPHPELFEHIDWGTPAVLAQTLEQARRHRLEVHLLDTWADADEWADLCRIAAGGAAAPRTRAWYAGASPGPAVSS
jgi:rSAM/selenodomain-associated transferase 1